jgi:hypothetical protein
MKYTLSIAVLLTVLNASAQKYDPAFKSSEINTIGLKFNPHYL